MSAAMAIWLVRVVGVYALVGVIFGVIFVLRGAGRIDPLARDVTWGFRLAILPGAVALWPLLLRRLLGGQTRPPTERNAHRNAHREATP